MWEREGEEQHYYIMYPWKPLVKTTSGYLSELQYEQAGASVCVWGDMQS